MPEAQRIEHPHHLGPHAAHVAHDAAHSGGRALDRQQLARMVVALVGEHQGQVLAGRGQRDHPRILPRSEQHVRSAGRQSLQQVPGGLVRAVFAPQDAEQHHLGPSGRTTEQLDQQRHLVGLQHHAAGGEPACHLGGIPCFGRAVRRGHAGRGAHAGGSVARANSVSTFFNSGSTSKQRPSRSPGSAFRTRGSRSSRARKDSPSSSAFSALPCTIR